METTAKQRVEIEAADLNMSKMKLSRFLRCEKFEKLDEVSKNLLVAQYHIMQSYEFILKARLDNWKD